MCVIKNILLPYNKFSPFIKYIGNVLSHRRGADNVDELDGIDDTRNGLLLWDGLHGQFGNGSLAFLKVSCRMLCFILRNLSIRNSNRPLIFIYLSMIFLTTHLDRKIKQAQQVVSHCSISMILGLAAYYPLPSPTTMTCENREILPIGHLLWFLILLMLVLLCGYGHQSPSSKLFGQ